MKDIRILLIDNSELIRRGVRGMLEQEEDMEIVGDCSSAEEAFFQMLRLRPNIVLMDTQLPGMNWIEATSSLKRNRPGAGVDVIILAESPDYRADAMKAGAASYLLKDAAHMEFTKAIRQVYRNSHPLKESISLEEEVIELVVTPPANTTSLLRFIYQLGYILHADFASIICIVGSWNKGTVITIRAQPNMPSDLAIELAQMPEVEKVEEKPPAKGSLSNLTDKFAFLSRLRISPSRRLQVTLNETTTGQVTGISRADDK